MAWPILASSDVFVSALSSSLPACSAFGLDGCANPSVSTTGSVQNYAQFRHPQAGLIDLTSHTLPYGQFMNIRWQPQTTFQLLDTTAFKRISANFLVKGSMNSQIKGLSQPLRMRSRTHNFIHTPETGHLNQLPGGEQLSMMILEIDADFLVQAIGQQDAWSERIAQDVLHQRPFSGGRESQFITPRMQWLIDDLANNQATGPLASLFIQSRALELLALQLEQYKGAGLVAESILPDDAQKLYQLKVYLDAHFLQEHSLERLSRYCGLNEFKVKRGFKQLFGSPVFNYLRKLRMDYAAQLLRCSSLSVEEVADQLGYEHSHHFAVAFRNYMGLNPSQYQRQGTA